MTTLTVPASNGNGAASDVRGGEYVVHCYGTFDSGTVTLEVSPDDGTTWYGLTDHQDDAVTFSGDGQRRFNIDAGRQLRAALSGSSGSTDAACELGLLKHYSGNIA